MSKDLQAEFPNMKGLTRRNLFLCKQFYQFYNNSGLIQQPVGQIVQQPVALFQIIENQVNEIIQQPVGSI